VPSPSFSSCWKELGCLRLSMVGAKGTVWPPPRLRTLMEESVRSATESVPACVGRSLLGGGRLVCCGSKRMSLAVVSLLAMRSGVAWAGAASASGEDVGGAVVVDVAGSVAAAASPGRCNV
jgi:hypothetical protein